MKIKVSAATPRQLNFMVAKCQGVTEFEFWHTGAVTTRWPNGITQTHSYADSWSQGGPIIERERIMLIPEPNGRLWTGCIGDTEADGKAVYAHTPLIAAMRCYVASKLGGEVEVPDELV